MSLWSDIINDAFFETGIYDANSTPTTADSSLAQRKLSRILDSWAARRVYCWSDSFSLFTLTPGHTPNLIGPGLTSPDFAQAIRPIRLEPEGAALVLTDVTPNVDLPLNVRDADWWNNQRVKALSTNVPTDVYYEPDWPNGSLYFWPVPAYAYGVRLRMRNVMTGVPTNLSTTFSAPPGYEKAVVLSLAEDLVTAFGRAMPPELPPAARAARAVIGINNQKSPRISSADAGAQGHRRSGFNWETGEPA